MSRQSLLELLLFLWLLKHSKNLKKKYDWRLDWHFALTSITAQISRSVTDFGRQVTARSARCVSGACQMLPISVIHLQLSFFKQFQRISGNRQKERTNPNPQHKKQNVLYWIFPICCSLSLLPKLSRTLHLYYCEKPLLSSRCHLAPTYATLAVYSTVFFLRFTGIMPLAASRLPTAPAMSSQGGPFRRIIGGKTLGPSQRR